MRAAALRSCQSEPGSESCSVPATAGRRVVPAPGEQCPVPTGRAPGHRVQPAEQNLALWSLGHEEESPVNNAGREPRVSVCRRCFHVAAWCGGSIARGFKACGVGLSSTWGRINELVRTQPSISAKTAAGPAFVLRDAWRRVPCLRGVSLSLASRDTGKLATERPGRSSSSPSSLAGSLSCRW